MKTIFYKTVYQGSGRWRISFWTKDDRTNMITETFVTPDEAKLRKRIENLTGATKFDLVQVRE